MVTAVGLVIAAAGLFVLWAAVTGRSALDEIAAVTGLDAEQFRKVWNP